ncbi:transcription antitermination protein NusB [Riemerella columbipharyngis]|uniref:N utilization substance protein B n=1 Tax=Riemerella columbipharyngis TaxID=1071918 RepID=A0A1G7ETR2_9FLAO|nr:transcription antitermination factor NusB [Riemerella columbipharyngis]SDE67038.1 N utilization substance protein B [Riemerella columbipharyngis]
MLGRRQIREKVVQTLYAYCQNPRDNVEVEREMFRNIEKIYNLYIYQLNFLVALRDLAEQQVEIAKEKYIKTEKDINPNLKFIQNRILERIESNQERLSFTSKHQDLKWSLYDDFLVKTFQRIIASKRYQDYMASQENSFDEDQKFIGKLFLKFIAENEAFHELLEDIDMNWADDFHIANSMIQKTIGFMKENEPTHTLIRVVKNQEDRDFARNLLFYGISHWGESEKKLEARLQNWDLDRVSLMDRVIIITAFTELDYFPSIPSRVIINEYIEIAKAFSTDKSQVFVNGLLGKYTNEINRV